MIKSNRILSYVNTIFRATGISLGKNVSGKFKIQKINKIISKIIFFQFEGKFLKTYTVT